MKFTCVSIDVNNNFLKYLGGITTKDFSKLIKFYELFIILIKLICFNSMTMNTTYTSCGPFGISSLN